MLIILFTQKINTNPIPSGIGLSIVAPTTISIPGNYRLANDIVGTITIAASNVCLDLENKTVTGNVNGIKAVNQEGISIKNGRVEGATTSAIFMHNCSNIDIINVDLVSNATGIHLLGSQCSTVELCTITNNSDDGIALENGNNCLIARNNIFSNGTSSLNAGILMINDSNNNKIIENFIIGNIANGILLRSSSSNNLISHNIINETIASAGLNADGIDVESDNNIISNNVCNNNQGNGIEVAPGNFNLILNNNCSNNQSSNIRIENNNNTITGNKCINSNEHGIVILGNATNNTINENEFNNNTGSGIMVSGVATNNFFKDNITNHNGTFGIENTTSTLNLNSFFSNSAQQNNMGNFFGIPVSLITTFNLGLGIFSPRDIFDNISII